MYILKLGFSPLKASPSSPLLEFACRSQYSLVIYKFNLHCGLDINSITVGFLTKENLNNEPCIKISSYKHVVLAKVVCFYKTPNMLSNFVHPAFCPTTCNFELLLG